MSSILPRVLPGQLCRTSRSSVNALTLERRGFWLLRFSPTASLQRLRVPHGRIDELGEVVLESGKGRRVSVRRTFDWTDSPALLDEFVARVTKERGHRPNHVA